MKTQIKDIVIGIFAVIGFTAVVMGFTNQTETQQVAYGTPESHIYEIYMHNTLSGFKSNKVTGEVTGFYLSGGGKSTFKVYNEPTVKD